MGGYVNGGLAFVPEPQSTIERVLATRMDGPWKRKVAKPGLLGTSMLFPAQAACQLFVE